MTQFLLKYYREYAIQTTAIAAMGLVWLGNSIYLGKILNPPWLYMGCGTGIVNQVATHWIKLAMAGYPAAMILGGAFGFICARITNGSRSLYALLIFVSPVFGLVAQIRPPTYDGYLKVSVAYFFAMAIVSVFFLPAFYLHRYLTRRCTCRPF